MRSPRNRKLLLVAVCSAAVLVPASVADAAVSRDPCTTAGFTGKAIAHASACADTGNPGKRGPRGRRGVQGKRGLTGARGLKGSQGDTGSQGETGFTGPIGPVGPQGSDGSQGPQGTDGADGPTGPIGPQGNDGPTGQQGVVGDDGAVGPTGAAGATGSQGPAGGLSQYGYVFNQGAQTVPIEADVIFDSNGISTPGINHAPGTTQIAVTTPGDYKVSFSVSGVEPGQFGLFLNGAPLTDTIYGAGAGTDQDDGQAIIALAAGDVLTLRNHSSSAAVTLQTLAGGTQTNVNASIVIEKLN